MGLSGILLILRDIMGYFWIWTWTFIGFRGNPWIFLHLIETRLGQTPSTTSELGSTPPLKLSEIDENTTHKPNMGEHINYIQTLL